MSARAARDGEVGSGSDGTEVSAETDRFGFILVDGCSAGSDGPSAVLVRQREAKWLNLISQWEPILQKKSSKVKGQCQKGIPASLRAKCWPLLCGATGRKQRNATLYQTLDGSMAEQAWVDVIQRDTDRQFPFHEMFQSRDGHGQRGLFRVLKAYTQFRPDEGYCQAQGPVAAVLLMNMPTEEAFWCLVQISELYLPGYYSPLLEGVLFDASVLSWVLKRACPAAHRHLQSQGVEPLMFATDWLMCLYTRHLPFNTLLRVWDLFFCHGVRVLFQVAVVLVRRVLGRAEQRRGCEGQMETLERLRAVKGCVQHEEADAFIQEVCSVPLSVRELQRQTERELERWRNERPDSTFDPRGRSHGYQMAWARGREQEEKSERKERESGNLSAPLMRSTSSLSSLSPLLLRKKWKKRGSKAEADGCEESGGEERGGRRVTQGVKEESEDAESSGKSVCEQEGTHSAHITHTHLEHTTPSKSVRESREEQEDGLSSHRAQQEEEVQTHRGQQEEEVLQQEEEVQTHRGQQEEEVHTHRGQQEEVVLQQEEEVHTPSCQQEEEVQTHRFKQEEEVQTHRGQQEEVVHTHRGQQEELVLQQEEEVQTHSCQQEEEVQTHRGQQEEAVLQQEEEVQTHRGQQEEVVLQQEEEVQTHRGKQEEEMLQQKEEVQTHRGQKEDEVLQQEEEVQTHKGQNEEEVQTHMGQQEEVVLQQEEEVQTYTGQKEEEVLQQKEEVQTHRGQQEEVVLQQEEEVQTHRGKQEEEMLQQKEEVQTHRGQKEEEVLQQKEEVQTHKGQNEEEVQTHMGQQEEVVLQQEEEVQTYTGQKEEEVLQQKEEVQTHRGQQEEVVLQQEEEVQTYRGQKEEDVQTHRGQQEEDVQTHRGQQEEEMLQQEEEMQTYKGQQEEKEQIEDGGGSEQSRHYTQYHSNPLSREVRGKEGIGTNHRSAQGQSSDDDRLCEIAMETQCGCDPCLPERSEMKMMEEEEQSDTQRDTHDSHTHITHTPHTHPTHTLEKTQREIPESSRDEVHTETSQTTTITTTPTIIQKQDTHSEHPCRPESTQNPADHTHTSHTQFSTHTEPYTLIAERGDAGMTRQAERISDSDSAEHIRKDPSEPSEPQPGNPVSSEPQPGNPVPSKPQPGNPVSTQPGNPVPSEPQPGNPASIHSPGVPGSSQPGVPESSQSGVHEFPQPGNPVSSEPQPGNPVPSEPQPGNPVSIHSPGIPESPQPGVPESSQLGVPESSQPGVPESSQPGVPESSQPGVPESPLTGIHEFPLPGNPVKKGNTQREEGQSGNPEYHAQNPSQGAMGHTAGSGNPSSPQPTGRVTQSNPAPTQLRLRRSSSSRSSYPRILSEEIFRDPNEMGESDKHTPLVPDALQRAHAPATDALQHTHTPRTDVSQHTHTPSPAHPATPQRGTDAPKRLGLFHRLRGQGTPKITVPKIVIEDFSQGEELSSKERRRRSREQKRREKEEKSRKKKEKDLEKERERERKKPQTRGKSFQAQSSRSGGDDAPPGNSGSQTLGPKRNSSPFVEAYF